MIHSLGHSIDLDSSPSKRMHEQMFAANFLQGKEICHISCRMIRLVGLAYSALMIMLSVLMLLFSGDGRNLPVPPRRRFVSLGRGSRDERTGDTEESSQLNHKLSRSNLFDR